MSKDFILIKGLENNKIVFLALSTASLVLWILTIAYTSFYYFPPDPLYFFLSLPITYWLGISILIVLIITGLYRNNEFLVIILVFLYVHGISAFVFETPRFSDVYLHSSGSNYILIYGTTNSQQQVYYDFPQRYSNQFPSAFIFLAILKLITGVDTFLLLKIIQFLVFFISVIFVYLTSKNINNSYAFLGVIIFIALSMFTTHFSPSTFAFIYYSFVVYSLVLIISGKSNNPRKILIMLIASLIIFPTINPTADYFISVTLIVIMASLLFYKRLSSTAAHTYIFYFSFATLLLTGWFVYHKEFGLSEPLDILERVSSGTTKSVFPQNPTQNYTIYSFISYALVFTSSLVALIMLIIVIILIKYRYVDINSSTTNLFILLSALLISPLLLVGIVLGSGDIGFIRRPYEFVLLVLPPFVTLSYNISLITIRYKRLLLASNKTIIILALFALILIPITKYGMETPTYVPYSSFYGISLLFHEEEDMNVITTSGKPKHIMHYYSSLYDKPTSSREIKLDKYVNGTDLIYGYNQVSIEIDAFLKSNYLDGYAIISKHESNNLITRYQAYNYTDYVSNNLDQHENLIVNIYPFLIYKNFE